MLVSFLWSINPFICLLWLKGQRRITFFNHIHHSGSWRRGCNQAPSVLQGRQMEGAWREKSEAPLQAKICKSLHLWIKILIDSTSPCRRTGKRRQILIQNLQKRTPFWPLWTQKLPKPSSRSEKKTKYSQQNFLQLFISGRVWWVQFLKLSIWKVVDPASEEALRLFWADCFFQVATASMYSISLASKLVWLGHRQCSLLQSPSSIFCRSAKTQHQPPSQRPKSTTCKGTKYQFTATTWKGFYRTAPRL